MVSPLTCLTELRPRGPTLRNESLSGVHLLMLKDLSFMTSCFLQHARFYIIPKAELKQIDNRFYTFSSLHGIAFPARIVWLVLDPYLLALPSRNSVPSLQATFVMQ